MQDFKKLEVWRKAHELTLDVYRATESFPRTEVYGLTTQLRRSCSSIPARDERRLGAIPADRGRLGERAGVPPLLARDLVILDESTYVDLSNRVIELKRMLSSLIARVRAASAIEPSANQVRASTTEN